MTAFLAAGLPTTDGRDTASRLKTFEARSMAEAIPHIVWMTSPDGATIYFNNRGTQYTGCPRETNYGWNWVTIVHPDDAERARLGWDNAVRTETEFELDYRIRRFDGTFLWHTFRALPVRDPDGVVQLWIGTATNIDAQKQLELSLRRSEREALETIALLQSIEAATPVGFKLVDRDLRVVRINETLAEVSGTTAAEVIGRTVQQMTPELWPHLEDAYRRALRGETVCGLDVSTANANSPGHIRHWLASYYPVRIDGEVIGVGNVVLEITDRKDAEDFRRIGNGVGKGVVVVFRDISEQKKEQAHLQRELATLSWIGRTRDAIDEDRLVLYSQPIVPLAEGRPSEELLVRMVGRNGEVILPGAFLPVAERYGLIAEIDRWVITQAARLAAQSDRVIETNLSATSIESSNLVDFIDRQIRHEGADPANLVFEITETALMKDLSIGMDFARGLREIGCGLALDDFGTGYGSFTYLKNLPLTSVKIDIEFVRDLATNPGNRHVVAAIVSLAKAFGLLTIAEGVENEETLMLLRASGVDFAQGFHLGGPKPVAQSGP